MKVMLYSGKGMKMFERLLERIIREKVDIAEMQYGVKPDGGTTHAIFILHQLQEQVRTKTNNCTSSL